MELKLEVIFYKKEGKMPVKFCENIGAHRRRSVREIVQ